MIESNNDFDSLIYSTGKSLKEHANTLDDATKKEIRKAVEEDRLVKDSDDYLKSKTESLSL